MDRHLTRVMAHKEVTVWSTSTTTTVHGKSLSTAKCKNVNANEKIELRDWDKDMTTGSLEHNSINDTFIYNELLVPKVGCWRGCTFLIFVIFFKRSTFVGSAWSSVFFHPCHNGQLPTTSKNFYTRSYPLHYFLILLLEKEPAFPFSMLSAKQGSYWYHFITSLVWRGPWLGIEPGIPALDAMYCKYL